MFRGKTIGKVDALVICWSKLIRYIVACLSYLFYVNKGSLEGGLTIVRPYCKMEVYIVFTVRNI